MSTKPMAPCALGVAILSTVLATVLAGCAGSPPVDDGAPHSFSEVRIGRPRQVADAPPPVEAAVAPARQAAANPTPASHSAPPAHMAKGAAARATPARAESVTEVVGPIDPAAAARRVDIYLAAQGYSAEDSDQGDVRIVTATRMAEPHRLQPEAACSLEAMRRPDFSAANLTVRLSPGANGVEVGVTSSFVEVNTNLISGALVREACRSRGVVEAGVRQAARGG